MVNKSDMTPHSYTDGESGNWLNHFGKLSGIAIKTEQMHTLWLNNYTTRYKHHRDIYICAPKHTDLCEYILIAASLVIVSTTNCPKGNQQQNELRHHHTSNTVEK